MRVALILAMIFSVTASASTDLFFLMEGKWEVRGTRRNHQTQSTAYAKIEMDLMSVLGPDGLSSESWIREIQVDDQGVETPGRTYVRRMSMAPVADGFLLTTPDGPLTSHATWDGVTLHIVQGFPPESGLSVIGDAVFPESGKSFYRETSVYQGKVIALVELEYVRVAGR